jgi:ferredoxin
VKIRVDTTICSGQARCAAAAPAVYSLDDEGYNSTDEREVADAQLADASRGALACPEGAITLLDDDGAVVTEDRLLRLAGLEP